MAAAVHDPVTGKALNPSQVFARDGNLCFESLQTQNAYYKMMEQGYVVEFEMGKPVLKPGKMERVWELSTPEGNLARITSLTKLPANTTTTALTEGKYLFQAIAPELSESFLAGTNRRKIRVELRVFGRSGQTLVSTDLELSSENAHQKVNFSVSEQESPAIARMQFLSPSMLHKLVVKSSLEKTVTSKKQDEEARSAIALAKSSMKPSEFLVELVKDAKGVGMTFKWDAGRRGAFVKSIDPVGVASRSKVIVEGDIVRSVQGVRVDELDFKAIQQVLRNVPMRVILVLEHAPPGWKYVEATTTTNHASAAAAAAAPPPPPPRQQQQQQPPPPPRPMTSAPPPPRPTSSAPPPRSAPPPVPPPSHQARPAPPPPLTVNNKRPPPPPIVTTPVRAARPPAPVVAAPAPMMRAPAPPPPAPAIRQTAAPPPAPIRQAAAPPPPLPPPAAAPTTMTTTTTTSEFGPEMEKYVRMKRAGLEEFAILNAMKRDGISSPPPGFFSSGVVAAVSAPIENPPTRPPVAASEPTPPTSETDFGPEYVKYMRMKKSGLPDGAVLNAMNRDSVAIPPGFFPPDVMVSSSHAAPLVIVKSNKPPAAAPPSGNSMVDALNSFDPSKLKKTVLPPAESAPAAPAVNPLMAELQKKAQGGLKKRTQEELNLEEEAKKQQQMAASGKNLFNVALMDKFKNANPDEDEDDDDPNDDEWEM